MENLTILASMQVPGFILPDRIKPGIQKSKEKKLFFPTEFMRMKNLKSLLN